ncbi:response regulator transcription factor [Sulfurimonas sp. MAG313]|nr:response regulator transcription factor [Sulfurimonas sp. MAG313]MDF1880544.1 response regulator transcription factor [Sulfurimonas sp. MAG313]
MKILLLEDEYSLRISVEEFLVDLGYDVHCFKNGDDAFDVIYSTHFDILLLDINVPGLNGFELLKATREQGIEVPTIFMTARTQIEDFEEGYACGCCDYIRKPFDLMELQLRITQAYKSFYFENEELLDFGDSLVYDTKKHQLLYKDEEITLSKTENEILELLLRCKNQAVSITSFQDEIWGEYVDPANIRVQINNLRKKLPFELIKNRRGVGYIIE